MLFSWTDRASWSPLLEAVDSSRPRRMSQSLMKEIYSGVVVYHACRAEDISSYYERGLMTLDRQDLFGRARALFLSGEFPELDSQDLERACAELTEVDDGRVFVALDWRDLLDECGHYLIYGSESLCGIAASLNRYGGRDYHQVLKLIGTPTLFRLRLQFDAISRPQLRWLVEAIRANIVGVRRGDEPSRIDFTFRVLGSLSGESVLGHSHPTHIRDPLLGMEPYRFDFSEAT
jgi:hypothetical protein